MFRQEMENMGRDLPVGTRNLPYKTASEALPLGTGNLPFRTTSEASAGKLEVKSQRQTNSNRVWSCSSAPSVIYRSLRLPMKEKIEDITRDKEGRKRCLQLSTRYPVVEYRELGWRGLKEDIVKLLLSKTDNKIEVIPIVGKRGVGKTKLARLVYDDVRVTRYFDFVVWITLREDIDVLQATKTFFQTLYSYPPDVEELNYLQVILEERLRNKKVLLVLDDVWHRDYSKSQDLLLPLLAGASESKIIMTTRSLTVASSLGTVPAYHLPLSFEDCLVLYAKHAFAGGSSHPYSKSVGREIAKKRNRLPSAANERVAIRLQVPPIQKFLKLKGSLPERLPPIINIYISELQELLKFSRFDPSKDSTTSERFPPQSSVLPTKDSSIKSDDASTDVPINNEDAEDSLEDISSSVSLKVSEMSELIELPPGLRSLKIKGCDALKSLPEELIRINPSLRHLYVIDCRLFQSFHGGHPPNTLETFYIRNCRNLQLFSPAAFRESLPLKHLCMDSSCDSLRSFPLTLFPSLRSFVISDCANFSSISVEKDHIALDTLEIRDCPKLVSFPEGGLRTPNLTSIVLSNCKNLEMLPDQLHQLKSLQSLFIIECPELTMIPEGGFPCSLVVLCISSCLKLTPRVEWGLHKLEKLSSFEIEGGCTDLDSFPKQKLLPRNLNSLRISGLPNLKFLDCEGLQHLTSLETLHIKSCSKLCSLPEEGLPCSLTSLYISECSLLKEKLQSKKGIDWYSIAHIPHIQIDEDVIS